MPHEEPTLLDILDLTDPIDRQIFKLSLTLQELQAFREDPGPFGLGLGPGGVGFSALEILRASARGERVGGGSIDPLPAGDPGEASRLRTDILGQRALQLFPSLVLPDFLKPLVLPEEDVIDPAARAAEEAVADKQTFTTLFTESLTARVRDDSIGRAELVRDTP